ncbi:MAG TPA: N-acetyl-gamma-glutamyl-phosphate reductase [Gemmatimonadales bacterium]|nr:N-acetyl-gamma-glutamyl-phosphate reductase [Gemmatimonadales bacterium]
MRVALVGAAGYVGGELLRILLQHPGVRECIAVSRSRAGKPIADTHPGLSLLTEARFSGDSPPEAARGRDVVFLALEHGQSSRVMAEVLDAGPGLVVDLASDFRIQDGSLYQRHYGDHPAPALVHRFRYALADVAGTGLGGATGLAAPGCFATAAALALFPLAGLPTRAPPAVFAVTGSSGAGVQPRPTTHHPARAHNLFAYSVMGHRHEGEVLEQWRAWTGDSAANARLMTHSGPFVRGIYATLHAALAEPLPAPELAARYRRAYEGKPFVRILDQPPELTHAVGTNLALIHAAASPDGREAQVMLALDNLIKGAGGQAVQAMNLALGLDETAGLRFPGMLPI